MNPTTATSEAQAREIAASEQMRDRIADFILQEIMRRDDQGSTALKVQRASLSVPNESTWRIDSGCIWIELQIVEAPDSIECI